MGNGFGRLEEGLLYKYMINAVKWIISDISHTELLLVLLVVLVPLAVAASLNQTRSYCYVFDRKQEKSK